MSAATTDSPEIRIEGVTEPIIERYFATLNAGDFAACSSLFAPDGVMHPPFESEIVGTSSIASYLEKEAKGIKLYPREGRVDVDNHQQFQVTGMAQTPLFSINVSWLFILSQQREIAYTKIKLLASPQDLLKLRQP